MAMIFNRDGRKIHIWNSSDGLRITGHFPTHWRIAGTSECWTLWDPPGGPCITSGMQLGDLHEDFRGLLADRIMATDDDNMVIIKCKSIKNDK